MITRFTYPLLLLVWQIGPLYWQLIQPGQYFNYATGAVWFTVSATINMDNKPSIGVWDAIWPIGLLVLSVAIAIITLGSSAPLSASVAAGGGAAGVSATVTSAIASVLVGAGLKASTALYVATAGIAAAKSVVTYARVKTAVKEALLADLSNINTD